jgi:ribonuclease P/MRP protein subunit RPP1
MLSVANHLGYSGIGITNHIDEQSLPGGSHDDIELVRGAEIEVRNSSKLHGLVGKFRKKVDVLVVHGGSESINRSAVENPNVDVLTNLLTDRDNGFNHVLAKAAHDNEVAIAFNLDAIIKQRGGRRVHALGHFRKNLQLARKYNVPAILTSNAMCCYDMRAPREMIALAGLFGMEKDEANAALSTIPEGIIKGNRRNSSIPQGVRIIQNSQEFC